MSNSNFVDEIVTSIIERVIECFHACDDATDDHTYTEAYRDAMAIIKEEVLSGDIAVRTGEYLEELIDMHGVNTKHALNEPDIRNRVYEIEALDD